MDPPSGRVPEQGTDWFLVAIEACGGGTPDLGYVLEVWGYIRVVGAGNKSGGPRGSQEVGGGPGGRARPPPSWMARDSSGPTLLLWGLLLVHKKSTKIGMSIGLRLVLLFYKTQKQGKTETVTVSRLIG